MTRNTSALSSATVLGLIALLPFAAGLYYAYTGGHDEAILALHWLTAYLATIVSFVGGAQWGRMLAAARAPALDMIIAVVPAVMAWAALLLGNPWQVLLLLAALMIGWLADENGRRRGWQGRGFMHLRRILTLVVALCVVALAWRVVRG